MLRFIGSSSGPRIRSETLADYSFTASAVARDRLVSALSGSTTTDKDASITSQTSATIDHEFDFSHTVDLSQPSPTIINLTPSVISISGLTATRIADGMASIIIRSRSCGRRIDFAVSRSNGQATQSGVVGATGSLGKHLIDSIATKLSGKTAPTFNGTGGASTTLCDIYSGTGVRNTSAWFGNLDLTCIPRSGSGNGVLITPKHMLCAWHYPASNPTFDDTAGNSYTPTIASQQQIGSTDIRLVTFTAAISSAITPAKLLPSNWANYLPQSQYGYPCVFTNQDRKLLIADTTTVASNLVVKQSGDSTRSPWFYFIRSGDSGSPCGMIINGNYVHLTNWYGYSGNGQLGPFDTAYITQINTAISGSGYSVSTVDLSGFNTYS